MAYRVCANLEEAEAAQANRLLWLRYDSDVAGDMWVAAHRYDGGPVRLYYGRHSWPPEDFAVLVEDEDSE